MGHLIPDFKQGVSSLLPSPGEENAGINDALTPSFAQQNLPVFEGATTQSQVQRVFGQQQSVAFGTGNFQFFTNTGQPSGFRNRGFSVNLRAQREFFTSTLPSAIRANALLRPNPLVGDELETFITRRTTRLSNQIRNFQSIAQLTPRQRALRFGFSPSRERQLSKRIRRNPLGLFQL